MDIGTDASATTNRRGKLRYRILHNISKLCKQQGLETIEKEETALDGCMIEPVKMLKETNKAP